MQRGDCEEEEEETVGRLSGFHQQFELISSKGNVRDAEVVLCVRKRVGN